jgi:glutamyl/glutaminyl-tRNA synthetase
VADIIRSRIAPTPSGFLHIGNACNFLLTEALTCNAHGSLRLRIDDLDAPRIRRAYIADIFETLHWLGISPDEGPADEAEQLRVEQYNGLLEKLVATGKVFACNCSRANVLRRSEDGQYPGTCRDKGLPLDAKNVAWRFRTNEGEVITWHDGICGAQAVPLYEHARDFIIRRRDGLPAYHVASLCDDVAYGINLMVRGIDLLYSTAAQLHLAEAVGLTELFRCSFYHHPLLKSGAGEKLSKSAGSDSLKAAREAGVPADGIRRMATEWYRRFLPESL